MIDAVLQGPLHADDDGYITGHAHFQLAISYLTGGEGLPVDYDLARRHLGEMLARDYPYTVQDGEGMLAAARDGLLAPARAVFDEAIAGHRGGTRTRPL